MTLKSAVNPAERPHESDRHPWDVTAYYLQYRLTALSQLSDLGAAMDL